MYIANIPAGIQLWQKENHESLYTGSWFPSPTSRGHREAGTDSADS